MKKLVTLFSLTMAMVLVFALFAACGKTEDDQTTSGGEGQTASGRTDVIIATANEPPTLHPYNHNAVAANYMNGLTYNTLMTSDLDTMEPIPCLAEKVAPIDDNNWEIQLVKGVKFHNGEEMKAADVKASMEWGRSDYSAYTSIYTNWWDEIEVVDDYTIRVHTPTPCAKATINLTRMKIVPKSLIDAGNDFNANPIGTGPYKFVKWTLGDSLEFEAFEDYFKGAPAIKSMTWRIVPEGSSRTIALEAGEIDFIVEVESNDLTRLQESKGITVLNQTGTGHNGMILNTKQYPFDNVDFRKALNCMVDKNAVMQVALNGAGTGIWGQTPAVFPGYSEENIDSYDLKKAQEYLDKSGMDPSTVVFSCICSDDVKRRAAEVIQANLAEFGITMNLESMDLATYLAAVQDGDFEAALGGYTTSDMMSYIEGKYLSVAAGGSAKNFTDDKLDELYLKAVKTLDEKDRMDLLEQCAARLNEMCPQVTTYLTNVTRAYNADLQGIKVSPSGGLHWEDVSWGE